LCSFRFLSVRLVSLRLSSFYFVRAPLVSLLLVSFPFCSFFARARKGN
jgi:hypothetical protein